MRSVEDIGIGCLNNCPREEDPGSNCINFEFQKTSIMNRPSHHHRIPLGKPTPSKWDDAQKWLVNLSRGEKNHPAKASPRNSNADDRRLIAPLPSSNTDDDQCVVETKNVDCDESIWRTSKPVLEGSPRSVVRSICLRDMGTDMTPIASKEPSRAATPIKATSPVSSGPSTPVALRTSRNVGSPVEKTGEASQAGVPTRGFSQGGEETLGMSMTQAKNDDQSNKVNPMEARAVAWEEAERAKYLARYKREEAKIQAWENHQKRKAEMENRKVEVKAERMKSRGKEKYNSRIAATVRIAEEKRANAEAKLNEKAMETSERADYIRRNGHPPSSFSFKLSSCCCW